MRIALLSDIHGNIFALETVLAELQSEAVDRILVAGDFVGYYPYINEVIARVRAMNVVAVLGNHDAYLLNPQMITAEKRKAYRLDEAAHSIQTENIDWLRQLPAQQKLDLDGQMVLLCHGSPWLWNEYVYPDFDNWDRFSNMDADIVVMGHTHIPFERQVGKVQLINPGSVGQPRDYQPGACYAILETHDQQVTFYRCSYDIAHLIEILQSRNFPSSLIQILIREKTMMKR